MKLIETRNDSLRSPNHFQILANANTDNCDKLIANENVNIQLPNNTFQGHPPQILGDTTSSTTANEPPSDINETNTATHNSNHHNGNDTSTKTSNIRTDRNNLRKIIASIKKVLKTTKILNQKEQLL